MLLQNAIKKASQYGKVQIGENGSPYSVKIGRWVVEWRPNGPVTRSTNITCVRMRRENDRDDCQSDYCAGSFMPSLTKALAEAAENDWFSI